MNTELESRLSDLEIKLAFQDDLLSTLNDVIAKQDKDIQNLWRANTLLKQSLSELKPEDNVSEEAPPPHY